MHIFFKLFAFFGTIGTIAGTIYFSQQKYTNIHLDTKLQIQLTPPKGQNIDVKRQPQINFKN